MIADEIVYPEKSYTQVAVEIKFSTARIEVCYIKDENFIKIIKGLRFLWNGVYWYRTITEITGSAEDRTVELGNELLVAGFPIKINDKKVLEKAIAGEYEEECLRWIYLRRYGKYEGNLAINWDGWNSEIFKRAKSLPGSTWSSPSIIMRIENFELVEEFSRLYDFKFTKSALDAIDVERKKTKILVKPIKKEHHCHKDGLQEILNSEDDIPDDLKD